MLCMELQGLIDYSLKLEREKDKLKMNYKNFICAYVVRILVWRGKITTDTKNTDDKVNGILNIVMKE